MTKQLILKKWNDQYLFLYINCDEFGNPNEKELGNWDSWINIAKATVAQDKQEELFNLLHTY